MPQNDSNENISDRDSRLMDALLSQSLRPNNAENESRVQNLLQAIQTDRSDTTRENGRTTSTVSTNPPRRNIRWFPVTIAAVALVAIALIIQPGGSQNSALAAVERSIVAEQRPEAREYEVTLVVRGANGRHRTVTHTLYVQHRNFAICATPRLGRGKIWLGGHGSDRWLVPRLGPVLVGSEGLLKTQLPNKAVVETPFLNVETILDRIKRFYDLKLTAAVNLEEPNGTNEETVSIQCDHIAGTRLLPTRVSIPMHVELWADLETGFARRIEMRWEESNSDSRWLKATARLIDTHDLAADFFDHTAHHDADRKVIHLPTNE